MSAQYAVPATPRVISPSPNPSEPSDHKDSTATGSSFTRQTISSPPPISEEDKDNGGDSGSDSSAELLARARSRSPVPASATLGRRRVTPADLPNNHSAEILANGEPRANGAPAVNGHLSPYDDIQKRLRDFSRSPSPLGLIPLHRHHRVFIHRHEIPRKLLHVSIGFVTLGIYRSGIQTHAITPYLISAFLPVAAVDFLRHRSETVNKLYIRCLGALMRETEVSGYNGVIWYMLGAYTVLRLFPKDVGVMGVLLLSWCDTAASTFGRLFGRHTTRIRRGKSLAGTFSAWAVGVLTAAAFWGYFVPTVGAFPDDPEGAFMFSGCLNFIPGPVAKLLENVGISGASAIIKGPLALGVVSVWTGIVAAGSELIDLFGWDDNFTIPVLSGVGMWGFLKAFGS